MTEQRVPAADGAVLDWGYRLVWLLCIGVYLVVFISGVQAGSAELPTLGKAIGFTLATAIVGRMAMSVIGKASLPAEFELEKDPPMASQDGTVGSLVDLVS